MSATITLDGRNVTGVTLDGVTITRGRSSIYEDIGTGVCVATLLSGDVAPDAWQGVSGYTEDYSDVWTGAGATRFTGVVTAVDYTPGELTITAVDVLEQLGRIYVSAARPAETDFNRAFSIATAAGVTLTYTGSVSVELAEVQESTDPVTASRALLTVSDNTDAQVYATRENRLIYRRRDTAPPAVISIPEDVTLTDNLVVTQELGDVYNVERVGYGAAEDRRTVERINQASITRYGRREWRQIETQLLSYSDATALADYWLKHDADPGYRVREVAILSVVGDDSWNVIADAIDIFTPVRISGLPTGSPIPDFTAAVLGYTETITQTNRTLALSLGYSGYLMEGVN
jgi:hypothetical protein